MPSSWFRAGSPDTFQVAVRWVDDPDPPGRRPTGHGWSMGEFEITAAGVCLTASGVDGDRQSHVGWYLSPLLGWLADNWHPLLHEERYSWRSKTVTPAAIACRHALNWTAADDPNGEENWCNTQAWYQRHGIRSAATGGIFPDLFIRRFADDIELSWSGLPAEFSPPGLAFESAAGQLKLPVMEVARPLWQTLCWAAEHPPHAHTSFGCRCRCAASQSPGPTRFDRAAPRPHLRWISTIRPCAGVIRTDRSFGPL